MAGECGMASVPGDIGDVSGLRGSRGTGDAARGVWNLSSAVGERGRSASDMPGEIGSISGGTGGTSRLCRGDGRTRFGS